MQKKMKQKKKKNKSEMPERIDASPEQIAEVVLMAKPKKSWNYLKKKTK